MESADPDDRWRGSCKRWMRLSGNLLMHQSQRFFMGLDPALTIVISCPVQRKACGSLAL